MFRRLLDASTQTARRVIVALVGGTVVLCGVALLVLPGPAFVVIPAGLAILSLEFAFAKRWLRALRAQAERVVGSVGSNGGADADTLPQVSKETAMPKGQSQYHKHPDHKVDLMAHSERVQLAAGGEPLADSSRCIQVLESKCAPVLYFPRDDVRMERLEKTEHQTHCPFKGDASYYSIRTRDGLLENSVWSYEDPFDEVAGLKDHLAFYADRVDWS
jgi:uncharacterized protein (DUF427 family)